jgi:outer membrane cobalamin receptor
MKILGPRAFFEVGRRKSAPPEGSRLGRPAVAVFAGLSALAGVDGTLATSAAWAADGDEVAPDVTDITDLSLKELLDPNVTTASRVTEKATEAPATVYVISKEDIRNRGYSTLVDVLRDLPGMETIEQYYSEQGTLVPVRGVVGNNKIVLLLNGMRVNPPGGEELMIHSDISVRFADQIEVIYGPGSTLYGQDAISAVINIKTKKPGETRAEALAAYGNHNTADAFASVATRLRSDSDTPISFTAFASYRHSDLSNLKKEYPVWWDKYHTFLQNIPGRDGDPSRTDKGLNVFGRLESKTASLQAWYRESERSSSEGSGEGGRNPVLWFVPEAIWKDRSLAVEAQHALELAEPLTLHSIATFNRYEADPHSRYVFPSGPASLFLGDFKYAVGTSASLEEKFDLDLGESTRVVFGFSATSYDVTPKASVGAAPDGADPNDDLASQAPALTYFRTLDPASRVDIHKVVNLHYHNYGAYAEGSHKFFEQLKVIAGIRVDVNSRFSETPISPRAAVIYNGLGGRLALKYIFSMAYVAPAPYFGHNVFDNGHQLSGPNHTLNPERETSNEVNATWKGNHLLLSASAYFNHQSDLLIIAQSENPATIQEQMVYLPNAMGNPDPSSTRLVRHSINLGSSNAWGTDLSARYNFGPVSGWASYSWMNFRQKLNDAESGLQQISHHNVRAGVTWSILANLSITPSLVYRSTPVVPARLKASGGAYDVDGISLSNPYEVNFNALYTPVKSVDVFVTLRNVTNNKYGLRGISGPTPQEPFWGMGGLRYRY